MEEPQDPHPLERQHRWLAMAKNRPPEWLAAHVASPAATWAAVTETGDGNNRQRLTAYLQDRADLPYWAFALAKSYLDDVGEWPLWGMNTEMALAELENHGDPLRAAREILETVKPVWSDLDLVFVGEEQR